MNKELPQWEVKAHSHQVADTGDYDGLYEITNGKISIFTSDESDDSDESEEKPYQKVADALNATKSKFWVDDSWTIVLGHYENEVKRLRNELAAKDKEIERLKKVASRAFVEFRNKPIPLAEEGWQQAWKSFCERNNLFE